MAEQLGKPVHGAQRTQYCGDEDQHRQGDNSFGEMMLKVIGGHWKSEAGVKLWSKVLCPYPIVYSSLTLPRNDFLRA